MRLHPMHNISLPFFNVIDRIDVFPNHPLTKQQHIQVKSLTLFFIRLKLSAHRMLCNNKTMTSLYDRPVHVIYFSLSISIRINPLLFSLLLLLLLLLIVIVIDFDVVLFLLIFVLFLCSSTTTKLQAII